MSLNFLDFEQPIAELEAKIDSLTAVSRQDEKLDINIDEEVHRLREKSVELTRKIFADLGAWQIAQLARHPQRPYTLDYVRLAFDEFDELAGDRAYADDKAIVGGIARLDGRPVMIIGHQKGRETKEKIRRNFGMPAPEGYRKALRLMQMAERFKMPIITFIDTPGAYPGVGAEAEDYDAIVTGDLGEVGHEILIDLLNKKGYDISKVHQDCGMLIYDNKTQGTGSGGSGCGCAASTLSAHFLPRLQDGTMKRILFVPTGALLSTVSFNEGQSIPGIAHGVVLESGGK